MCIVVDMNTLAPVFNEKCEIHHDFAPIREWIVEGDGHLVYGGSKYKDELKKTHRYLRLVRKLKDAKKAFEIQEDLVDQREREVIGMTNGTACNDQHLIAILYISRCILFCSKDKEADEFIKDKRFYPKNRKPKIYRSIKNKSLIHVKNIVSLHHIV